MPARPGRRADESPRHRRRGRRHLRARADRPLSRARRRVPRRYGAPGQQRGALRMPGVPLRRRPLRGRALRPLAVRGDPGDDGLEPVLSWRSYVAQAKTLGPGESTGYGRRFVADGPRGSGSSRWATRTASAAASRDRGARRRRRAAGSSAPSRWTPSPSSWGSSLSAPA